MQLFGDKIKKISDLIRQINELKEACAKISAEKARNPNKAAALEQKQNNLYLKQKGLAEQVGAFIGASKIPVEYLEQIYKEAREQAEEPLSESSLSR